MNFKTYLFVVLIAISLNPIQSGRKENKTETIREWVQGIIEKHASSIAKLKRDFISSFKSWAIIEPTERETVGADEAMSLMFSIGTDKLLDTTEKFEFFCRKILLVEARAWVIRKFTFHLNIRVILSMILTRINNKNDLYCADDHFKQNYVSFTKQLTPINGRLGQIQYKYIDTLVTIQDWALGITKLDNLCCGFWRYRRETIDAIPSNNTELRMFVEDMIDTYFGDSLKYMCLGFGPSSSYCHSVEADPPQAHLRYSLLMNMIEAMAKIENIVFRK